MSEEPMSEEALKQRYYVAMQEMREEARKHGESAKLVPIGTWMAEQGYEIEVGATPVPVTGRSDKSEARAGFKYPWDVWTDGEWHEAWKGEEFQCSLSSFRAYLYRYGLDNGYTVETSRLSINPPAVQFRFSKPEVSE